MNTITRLVVYAILAITFTTATNAQEKEKDSTSGELNTIKIESLKKLRVSIEEQERDFLKSEIEAINRRLDNKEITAEKAEELKKEVAKKRALNIENRIAIIDNKISLLERNNNGYNANEGSGDGFVFRIGGDDESNETFIYFGDKAKNKPRQYDRRTKSYLVYAAGLNNTLIEGQSLSDSPYKIGGSGFAELGYIWKTRIFEDTNFWRFSYGLSFQWNKLDIKDNNYLVNTDGDISLQEFTSDLDKAMFRSTNLVVPLHLEFGPSKKIEKDTYFRYSTFRKFKIGIGGYAGLNIGNMQKLKYKEEGSRIKNKQRGGYEVNEFVYGLSGYIGIGNMSLYAKYDISPLFKNQAVDQNNISLGLRFDMD